MSSGTHSSILTAVVGRSIIERKFKPDYRAGVVSQREVLLSGDIKDLQEIFRLIWGGRKF